MGFPLYVNCCFSLAAFNILSLCLVFVSLISMCLGVFLLGFILYRTLCTSWTWLTISFSMLGKFSTIISSKIFSYPFFFSSAAATAKSLQSCPTLCDPIDGSPPGVPVPGILQARTLEWVAISFSSVWKWKVKVKSLSCVRLLVTPWTAAYQAPPSMGFSRQEYWSGVPLPSPGDLLKPGIRTQVSCITGRFFYQLSHKGSPGILEWVDYPSEKARAPHSSTLAWKIPWAEGPGRLQSMGSPRVGHDWVTSLSLFTFIHWRRKWQPTPVFLPGESQGRGSLVGCRLWGCTESGMTEVT